MGHLELLMFRRKVVFQPQSRFFSLVASGPGPAPALVEVASFKSKPLPGCIKISPSQQEKNMEHVYQNRFSLQKTLGRQAKFGGTKSPRHSSS